MGSRHSAEQSERLQPLDTVHSRVRLLFALLTVLSVVILTTMGVRLADREAVHYLDVGWMSFFATATVVLTLAEISCLRSIRTNIQPQLASLVLRDEVTGLYNRRYIVERIDREISLCRRHGRRFSVIYTDMDGFKQVNDRYGHDSGDHILRQVGRWLEDSVRHEDIAGRMGGDEFVVLLPDTSPSDAANLVIRLDTKFRAQPFRLPNGEETGFLAFSAGIAAYPGDGETSGEVLSVADRNMYAHKKSKR